MSRFFLISALALCFASVAGAQVRHETTVLSGAEQASAAETISISVKNADLQDVLRMITRTAGLNLVLDDDLKGKTVTLDLTDVPWDVALDLVLKTHGLGSEWNGNVLHVDGVADLTRDIQQRAKLRELQRQSGQLVSVARTLSHANATAAETLVKQHLSDRGQIAHDRRTNTLIIRDTPEVIRQLTKMLDFQDAESEVSRSSARQAQSVSRSGPTLVSWNSWLLESSDSFVRRLGLPGSGTREVTGTPAMIGRAELDYEDLELAKLLLGRLTEQGRLSVLKAQPFGLGPAGRESIELGPLGRNGDKLRLDLGLERDGGRFVLTFRCFGATGRRLPLAWHGPTEAGWIVELQPTPGDPWRVLLIAPAS